MRKLAFVVLLAAVVAAAYLWFFGIGDPWTIRLTEADLQRRLDEGLPVEKDVLLAKLALTEAVVALEAGADRIEVRARIVADTVFRDAPYHGTAVVRGAVRYEPGDGGFYLDDAIVELEAADLTQDASEALGAALTGFARNYFGDAPLYELDPERFRESLTRLFLESVEIRDGVLLLHLAVRDSGDV